MVACADLVCQINSYPYLRYMLRFLGLDKLKVVAADKKGFGEEVARRSVDEAIEKLSTLAENFA